MYFRLYGLGLASDRPFAFTLWTAGTSLWLKAEHETGRVTVKAAFHCDTLLNALSHSLTSKGLVGPVVGIRSRGGKTVEATFESRQTQVIARLYDASGKMTNATVFDIPHWNGQVLTVIAASGGGLGEFRKAG